MKLQSRSEAMGNTASEPGFQGIGSGLTAHTRVPWSGTTTVLDFDMESQFSPPPPGSPIPASHGGAGSDRSSTGQHLTTFTHEGRFWDVYLEFVDDALRPASCRGRLCFVPTDQAGHEEPARTTVIIIEPTYEEAMVRAGGFDQHNLSSMLRSVRKAPS